jgi:N-acetylglucosaminyl-diphospho-decaprenol L-rhamnosyltransferase
MTGTAFGYEAQQTAPAADPGRKVSAYMGSHSSGLSILCVNWNSLCYLRACIGSIYQNAPHIPFEIVVVDNASPEGGIDAISELYPEIRLVKSNSNLGFAGANNLGFRHCSGEYILLLNPDTEILGGALDLMLEQLRNVPDAGIVGCKLLNSDMTVSTTSIQKFPTIINQVLTAEFLRLKFPDLPLWSIGPLFRPARSAVRVDVIPGACIMIKRSVFEQVGLLSDDYFMYAEDIDLNYKVRKLGLSSYYVGAAEVLHHGGKSSTQQPVSQWSTIMVHRAMVRYFRKSRGPAYSVAYRFAIGCAACFRLLILAGAFVLGNRKSVRCSASKWSHVLRWSLGFDSLRVS